jgi:type I restriction enzyme R subunit
LGNPSEAKTRKDLIDPALMKAGWDITNPTQVGLEIPVDGSDIEAWQRLEQKLIELKQSGGLGNIKLPTGVSDYALYRSNGEVFSIVEAKRTSIDPRSAQAQAEFYVNEIAKKQKFPPYAFMTNGYDIYFWDVGNANKRLVYGFFSPEDLENMLYLREHRVSLDLTAVNPVITNRVYQQEAIKRVCETFEQGKRKALIVMATGTGKTRTAVSLVDIFIRSNQARKILFVADRDALVEQARKEGFEAFLPDEPCGRIFSHNIDRTKRLYVSTLQTLSNCFEEFTPGFFDLLIFDEVHRSIFNKWNEVLQYFDARMIGLTATPADFIDRNTFLAFECTDGRPTFLYSYDRAIEDGYLVNYRLYKAQTKFQRKGIRGVDLSEEEKNALTEQGIDPDDLDFSGTELEREISNTDTLRKQWEEIIDVCYKDQSGQLPGKTIVFAMTQEHAQRVAGVFESMYPQWPNIMKVITSQSEYKGTLIDQFRQSDMPRIAISVDMLDTGINVPEVVNLVFMKPVQSRIKLEQMIGRGTRSHDVCHYLERLPNGHKEEFLIIDFWENDFNKEADEDTQQTLPVAVRLFNIRLKLLEHFMSNKQSNEYNRAVADLRSQISQIPTVSFSVKRIYPEIEDAWKDSFWGYITADKINFLKFKIAPLLRYLPEVDVAAVTFTCKVERLKLYILTGKQTTEVVESIADDVSRLPSFVEQKPKAKHTIELCLTPRLHTATVDELNLVIETLADEMKNRRAKQNSFLTLDLPDYIEMRGYIYLEKRSERMYVEEYRKHIEERIFFLADTHPTIQALRRGEQVNDSQLIDLERTLRSKLGTEEYELSEENIKKAYGLKVGSLLEFLRYVLELDSIPGYQVIVKHTFESFISEHQLNANQIRFLQVVQSVFLQKKRLALADLYGPPLTAFGSNAVERWFKDSEIKEILALTDSLTVTGE